MLHSFSASCNCTPAGLSDPKVQFPFKLQDVNSKLNFRSWIDCRCHQFQCKFGSLCLSCYCFTKPFWFPQLCLFGTLILGLHVLYLNVWMKGTISGSPSFLSSSLIVPPVRLCPQTPWEKHKDLGRFSNLDCSVWNINHTITRRPKYCPSLSRLFMQDEDWNGLTSCLRRRTE